MANGGCAGQAVEKIRIVEYFGNQTFAHMAMDGALVHRHNPGPFLSTVLLRVEAQVGQGRRFGVTVYADNATHWANFAPYPNRSITDSNIM